MDNRVNKIKNYTGQILSAFSAPWGLAAPPSPLRAAFFERTKSTWVAVPPFPAVRRRKAETLRSGAGLGLLFSPHPRLPPPRPRNTGGLGTRAQGWLLVGLPCGVPSSRPALCAFVSPRECPVFWTRKVLFPPVSPPAPLGRPARQRSPMRIFRPNWAGNRFPLPPPPRPRRPERAPLFFPFDDGPLKLRARLTSASSGADERLPFFHRLFCFLPSSRKRVRLGGKE